MSFVAFDLDGTLIDSLGGIQKAVNTAFASRLPAPLTAEETRILVGHGARHLVEQLFEVREKGAAQNAFVDERLQELDACFLKEDPSTAPFKGLVPLLTALKKEGVGLCVATNKPGAWAHPLVSSLFGDLFCSNSSSWDGVFAPEDAGAHKPDAAFLENLAKRVSVESKGALLALVGDSVVDAQAVQNYNGVVGTAPRPPLECILVRWGMGNGAEFEAQPTSFVDDPAALEKELRRLLD